MKTEKYLLTQNPPCAIIKKETQSSLPDEESARRPTKRRQQSHNARQRARRRFAMVTQHDIEIYLDDCGFPFEVVSEGIWRVESPDNNVTNIILSYQEPILLLRVNLMNIPDTKRETFYERLLCLNATDIPHGAFGIEDERVVLIDTLQVENLDRNELQASIDSLGFTVAQYYNELKAYFRAS
ncbi:hypothetical protein GF339_17465 [candidate division KSB3 bacterium]|uniref:YbjN domain-containing protein n=1 Tax=candidate division KSB3 bacterium TaxID=2044937 RepID=A0A9D5JYY7_9BACT|nr:hypothetical protein [candidate division KSB3 bacterium]MBD3326377.1 hypothetical protein [candidate division KSB3 bacterium]